MSVVENVMLAEPHQSGERFWANWLTPRRVARQERATYDEAMDLLSFVALRTSRASLRACSPAASVNCWSSPAC